MKMDDENSGSVTLAESKGECSKMQGTVKWFGSKGYGFITGEDGKDFFVHHSDIQMEGYRKLIQGETVEFETAEDLKGPKAINVQRVIVAAPEAGLVASE